MYHYPCAAGQWLNHQCCVVEVRRARVTGVENAATTGQHLRPALGHFTGVRGIQWRSRTTGRRHLLQDSAPAASRLEHNHPVRPPCAAPPGGGSSEGDRRSAADRDLLERATGKEANPLAIWREEWIGGASAAGKRNSVESVEAADKQRGALAALHLR
jgi:hypothetical protein